MEEFYNSWQLGRNTDEDLNAESMNAYHHAETHRPPVSKESR
jgi:hypothetical protein